VVEVVSEVVVSFVVELAVNRSCVTGLGSVGFG
jgi:hypothetical protein